jgi:ABC-type transporter MlaC component
MTLTAKKDAHDEVVKIIQRQRDEVLNKIRTNKREINRLADEQAKLKKVRSKLTDILRTVTVVARAVGSTFILHSPEDMANYAKTTQKALKSLMEDGMYRTKINKVQVTFYVEPFNG